jgi:hypothetical protein
LNSLLDARPLVGLFLAFCSSLAGAELATLRAAADSITSKELQAHVDVLADDSFEGREAGTRGGYAAGGYVVKQLQTRGLKAAGEEGSFYHTFGNGYRNILGMLEGSDPELKQHVVVVAAHYDHVGYGNRSNSYGPWGYVHNGADDNASGIAGVLEVVDAVLAMPQRPKRSILFAFFDGEEKGLLGSKQWAAAPTIPLNRVHCMVNCDMIGRLQNERVEVYGIRTAHGLRRVVCESNQLANLKLDFNWEMKENSDHYSFFARRIPVLMLHTGLHNDYHRPSDDAHLLNPAGMQEVSRLLFSLVYQLADSSAIGTFRSEAYQESPAHQQALEAPLRHAGPRLGVVSQKIEGEQPKFIIEEVTAGSPADRGGIRAGDRWVRFAGKPVTDLIQFRLDILTAKSPVDIELERRGADKPVELKVELDGNPIRVGITWRSDEVEPDTVLITQVVFGSPAQLAGLAVKDRIYEINGARFASELELQKMLQSFPGPLRLLIERDGRFRTAILEVPPPATAEEPEQKETKSTKS